MRDMRAWLEETADLIMRDSTTTVTLPPGVCAFEYEVRIEVGMPEAIDLNRAVERPSLVFAAALADGSRIESTRE